MPSGQPARGFVCVRGARTHNLQSVDVDLPHGRFVAVVGPSGSGKSSLVFDTVYAEAQRQYLETLSLAARHFVHQLERPNVERVEGLQPTICVDQNPRSAGRRHTVGTLTEIHAFLAVLFARLGTPYCPTCDLPIAGRSVDELAEEILHWPTGTRLVVLAQPAPNDPRSPRQLLAAASREGFLRVRLDERLMEIEQAFERVDRARSVETVVDRLVIRPGCEGRLRESLALAASHHDGLIGLLYQRPEEDWQVETRSTANRCPHCGYAVDEIQPRHFHFHSPYGVCERCEGLGTIEAFEPDLVLVRPEKSLADGAAPIWPSPPPEAVAFLARSGHAATPIGELPDRLRQRLLHGSRRPAFPGLLTLLEKEWATCLDASRKRQLEQARTDRPCPECHGTRLGVPGRSVRLGQRTLAEVLQFPLSDALRWLRRLTWPDHWGRVARSLVDPIETRLTFLRDLGLGYLSLGRGAPTLSGGEFQRVRLANGIGNALSGVCYILDEPSVGLHAEDNARLIRALKRLKRQGNSLLVVEHDRSLIAAADWVVQLGPGAGPAGGRIVATGPPSRILAADSSPDGAPTAALARQRRPVTPRSPRLRLDGASLHNLRNVDLEIPTGHLVGVSGVSGSGKSSLIHLTLVPALLRKLGRRAPQPGPFRQLAGNALERGCLERVAVVDQKPLGRASRSNPATFTGIFDLIRDVFAETKSARQRGFRAARFSFNSRAGQCPTCRGMGRQRLEMGALAELTVICPDCQGRRFNESTLEVRYRQRNIAEVLELTAAEARDLFSEHPRIAGPLQCLVDVGLDYLALGQAADTLSGGEAQRLKLAAELGKPTRKRTLFVLDEPTTGLHHRDIQKLLDALDRLLDAGHTVLVVEHQLDLLASVDWLIDLGPGAGRRGGRIVAAGPPETIAQCPDSLTGKHLRPYFDTPSLRRTTGQHAHRKT